MRPRSACTTSLSGTCRCETGREPCTMHGHTMCCTFTLHYATHDPLTLAPYEQAGIGALHVTPAHISSIPHAFCGPAGRYSAPGSTHPACCYLHMFPCIRTGRMAVSAVQAEWQCPCQRLHNLCPPTLCPRSASSLSRPCTPAFGRHRGTTQRTATGAARTTGSRTPSRRCRITVAFPDSSGKSASTAPSAVRSSSPPALATRPPCPHARTQAGRALVHPPQPLCYTRHPGLAAQVAAAPTSLPPPPSPPPSP